MAKGRPPCLARSLWKVCVRGGVTPFSFFRPLFLRGERSPVERDGSKWPESTLRPEDGEVEDTHP